MKVIITKEAREYLTLAEMPAVRQIIQDFKSEDSSERDYFKLAVECVVPPYCGTDILRVNKAEIAKNSRIWDALGEGTGNLDVWIEGFAYNFVDEILEIGAYVSDILSISDAVGNREEIASRIHVRKFKEVKS